MNSHATTNSTIWADNSKVKMRSANSFRRRFALAVKMGVGRHERRIECAFRENRPEVIGQAQGHEKRVGHRPGAKDRREHDVARKKPVRREKERVAANGKDTTEHAPLLQHGAALQNGEIRLTTV